MRRSREKAEILREQQVLKQSRQRGGRQEGDGEVSKRQQETQGLNFTLHAIERQSPGPKITLAARWEMDC